MPPFNESRPGSYLMEDRVHPQEEKINFRGCLPDPNPVSECSD